MAWAQEMKNLAAEIRTSHKDRTVGIKEIKRATRDILGAADDYMKKVSAELKEMARDLKDFLAKSEETRKKDFNAMMGGIQAKIKDIKGDVKDLLSKSKEKRVADFKVLMKDIKNDIEGIKGRVQDLKKESKGMIANYKTEREEAGRYWAPLRVKEEGVGVKEEGAKKREGRKKLSLKIF